MYGVCITEGSWIEWYLYESLYSESEFFLQLFPEFIILTPIGIKASSGWMVKTREAEKMEESIKTMLKDTEEKNERMFQMFSKMFK